MLLNVINSFKMIFVIVFFLIKNIIQFSSAVCPQYFNYKMFVNNV